MQNKIDYLVTALDKPDLYRYLLLDPLKPIKLTNMLSLDNIAVFFDRQLDPSLDADAIDNDLPINNPQIVTLLRPELSYNANYCPKLLLLASKGETVNPALLAASLQQADREVYGAKRYVCGWIVTDLAPEPLNQRLLLLGHKIAQANPYSEKDFSPFYEPLRLQLLHEGNSVYPYWLPQLLSGIDAYHYYNVSRQIATITGQQAEPSVMPFLAQLSAEAILYQQYLKHIFLCLAPVMARSHSNTLSAEQFIDIRLTIKAALELGARDPRDLFAYVINRFTLGIDLMQSPKIANMITEALTTPGSLQQRLSMISDDEWEYLR